MDRRSFIVTVAILVPSAGLRCSLDVQKDYDGSGAETYTLGYTLSERVGPQLAFKFRDVLRTDVRVRPENNPAAASLTNDGASEEQIEHLKGPITSCARRFLKGDASEGALRDSIEKILLL